MKSQPAEAEDPAQGLHLGFGDTRQTGSCWSLLPLMQPMQADLPCGTSAGASDTARVFLNPFQGNL